MNQRGGKKLGKRYIPHTEDEIREMLNTIGVSNMKELFVELPSEKRVDCLRLKSGMAEADLMRKMLELSERNTNLENYSVFMGGGIYKHLIPYAIQSVVERGEFLTAYTPYQAEVSQGSLQMFYEFQTMIAELTGLEVANSSMYDGGTAAAEAMLMSCNVKRKNKYLVSKALHPEYIEVMKTYAKGPGIEIEGVDYDDQTGMLDLEDLKKKVDQDTAGVMVGYPNFFGVIENISRIRAINDKLLLGVSVNPLALSILEAPGKMGADIVTGEAQPFGGSLYLGGMSLGIFASKRKYIRKMPGRIIGQTVDEDGNRGFSMILQTREQHIRRGKATSNICSNHAHNALVASMYLSLVGKTGLKKIALNCARKAHYLAEKIDRMDRYSMRFNAPFFNEFTIDSQFDPDYIQEKMQKEKIMGPLPIGKITDRKDMQNLSLVAVTEANRMEEINFFAAKLEELL